MRMLSSARIVGVSVNANSLNSLDRAALPHRFLYVYMYMYMCICVVLYMFSSLIPSLCMHLFWVIMSRQHVKKLVFLFSH